MGWKVIAMNWSAAGGPASDAAWRSEATGLIEMTPEVSSESDIGAPASALTIRGQRRLTAVAAFDFALLHSED